MRIQQKPPSRGRRPNTGYNQWELALDLIDPATARRRNRVVAAMANRDATGKEPLTTFKDISRVTGLDHRKVWTYVIADPKRPDVFLLEECRTVATCLTGDAEGEPWVSKGIWRATNGKLIVPTWLRKLELEKTVKLFAYWLAEANLRAGQQHDNYDSRVQLFLSDDVRLGLKLQGRRPESRHGSGGYLTLFPVLDVQRLAPKIIDDPRMQVGAEPLMAAMKTARLDAAALWRKYPGMVQKAGEAILAEV